MMLIILDSNILIGKVNFIYLNFCIYNKIKIIYIFKSYGGKTIYEKHLKILSDKTEDVVKEFNY